MDFEDLVEGVDHQVLSLLIPLALLGGAVLVQRATKHYQRLSEEYGFGVSACGLTGESVARRLLTTCGIDDVAVVATTGRDLYHPKKREVQLTAANYSGRSLAALAIAAHEVGHAQQYASKRSLYRLREAGRRVCQVIAVAALMLLLGATVLPLRNVGLSFLVLSALAVVLQAAATLPMEHDASRRAKGLVQRAGLIAPEETARFDRLLNAAWLTYAAAEARRSVGVLIVGILTIVWCLDLAPVRLDLDGQDLASQELREGLPRERFLGTHILIVRLIPLVVIGYLLLRRFLAKLRVRPSRAQRAAERSNAALASYTQGDYAAALRLLDEAIGLTSESAMIYFNRGSVYIQLAQWDRARADFDRALALNPNLPEVQRMRGNIWLQEHDYDRALADFGAAIEQAPTVSAGWRDRGLTLLRRGDFDRAIADLDEAIRLDATDAVAFNNRGVVRMKRGEPAQARADLEEAIRLDPNLPNPRQHLATLDAIDLPFELRE